MSTSSITIYSKANCFKCDGSLRTVGTAIKQGRISAAQVTVVMIDGTEPKEGKIPEGVEVRLITDPVRQQALLDGFAENPTLGRSAPVFTVLDEGGEEIDAWNDLRPDKMEGTFKAMEKESALAATA